ncbi:hypothetical protein DFJ73DRAFT_866511 [Zopfochytrium polystomum]|nr:hypothetical protein DFJ73DRAFT_866511 [Zopfochytrium polystomum]
MVYVFGDTVSLVPLSTVTASSTNVGGECAPNLCDPSNVKKSDGSRWMSNPVSVDNSTNCPSEWLHFTFPADHKYGNIQVEVEYGNLSWTFDHNRQIAPKIFFQYPDAATLTYVVPSSKDGTSTRSLSSQPLDITPVSALTHRVDEVSLYFLGFESHTGYERFPREVRLRWDDIARRGAGAAGAAYECALDVVSVTIMAVADPSLTINGPVGDGGGSGGGAGGLAVPTVVVAAIGVAVGAVAAVGLLMGVRWFNMWRRKQRSAVSRSS